MTGDSYSDEQLSLEPFQEELVQESLEKRYVQGGQYVLKFKRSELTAVERIFDQIIGAHGYNSAQFTYKIVEDDSESKA